MLSVIISTLVAILVGFLYSTFAFAGYFGIIFFAFVAFVVCFIILMKKTSKPLMASMNEVQSILQEGQKAAQRKMQSFQGKSVHQNTIQKSTESIQKKAVYRALEFLEKQDLAKYKKWNFLLSKQVETLKFQLYFQIREYEKADQLLDNVMSFDVSTIAMKLVRVFKRDKMTFGSKEGKELQDAINSWEVFKLHKKTLWRVKGGNKSFLYSLYAYFLVKKQLIGEAINVLTAAQKKHNDESIQNNLTALQNGKIKQYNMSKYGQVWWSLHLQEMPKVKQQRVKANSRRPF